MAQKQKQLAKARSSRVMRNRKKLNGTLDKPRMAVVRTNSHLYVQLIDDENGKTLASVSTLSKAIKDKSADLSPLETAKIMGVEINQKAKELGITRVMFDRRWTKFHGQVKAVADGAQELLTGNV